MDVEVCIRDVYGQDAIRKGDGVCQNHNRRNQAARRESLYSE